MINIKSSILGNIKKAFRRLRRYGDNNYKLFKKILSLIIIDDLFEWSFYLDDKQAIQKKLQEMRIKYLTCNKDLEICRDEIIDQLYINVNTPQTNYTWNRVWDDSNAIVVQNVIDYSNYLNLTELYEIKSVDGEDYLYSENVPIDTNDYIQIIETNINNNDYITK